MSQETILARQSANYAKYFQMHVICALKLTVISRQTVKTHQRD